MGDVYSYALRTYIWLGEASENTVAAFKLIDDFLVANRQGLLASISNFDDYDNEYLNSDRKTSEQFPDAVADFLESERLRLYRFGIFT
jgi:hypothetical protein